MNPSWSTMQVFTPYFVQVWRKFQFISLQKVLKFQFLKPYFGKKIISLAPISAPSHQTHHLGLKKLRISLHWPKHLVLLQILKGIFSDSFYGINQEIFNNRKRLFPKFQLILIFYLQVMHDMCIGPAPQTTVLNKFSYTRI